VEISGVVIQINLAPIVRGVVRFVRGMGMIRVKLLRMKQQNKINKAMVRCFILIVVCLLMLTGCEGLQVNIPVEVQSGPRMSRAESALWVFVENKSNHQIKITYPISTGMLKKDQHTVFRFSNPGTHKVMVIAYAEDPHYPNVYQPIGTIEIPVFLNGYDVVKVKERFVGYYLEITDGMLSPHK
jgi:hypothetical protein